MATYRDPVTDWNEARELTTEDMNRVEENIEYLKDLADTTALDLSNSVDTATGLTQGVGTGDDVNFASVTAAGGIDTSGTKLITKVIEIGDWNMFVSSGGSLTLDYGIGWFASQGITQANVVNISVMIRSDVTPQIFDLLSPSVSSSAASTIYPSGGYFTDRFGRFALFIDPGSYFSVLGTFFESTSFNRGYITITYIA